MLLTTWVIGAALAADREIDRRALRSLAKEARAAGSDAVVVWFEGQPVLEWYEGGEPHPIEAMSVTKSVVALAVGRLLTTGAISSLDTPVHTWFPEWRQGRKAQVTVRHLLAHTSGLQDLPSTDEIYPSPDFVQLALCAELTAEPGAAWFYSNKASNLLPAIVARAAGQPIDAWLRSDLFAALGIESFSWTHDAAGNPHGMSGLQIRPGDLARLGQLVLDRGTHDGQVLIDPAHLDALATPGERFASYGLQWWLVPAWRRFVVDEARLAELRAAGVDPALLHALAPAAGSYDDERTYYAALTRALGPDWSTRLSDALGPLGLTLSRKEQGPIVGLAARGYLGQYLVVYPDLGLVGVRMVSGGERYDPATHGFDSFETMLRAVVR